MNLVVIGCVHSLFLFCSILAQTTIIASDDESTTIGELTTPHEIQLEKFSELRHHLRSGPIVVVNKTTFFVPNLHYDGLGPRAHFWVGIGAMPDENGTLVPDENGSEKPLKAYNGENVYITLPKDITTDSIEYFGLWCIQYTQNFGHVVIPKNLNVPSVSNLKNDDLIMRVQKCCPVGQSMDVNYKCVVEDQPFKPKIDIRMGRNQNVDYAPFINNIVCTKQGKSLETMDGVSLFSNGSISKDHSIWNQDEYCLETCNSNNDTNPVWKTTAVVCKSKENTPPDAPGGISSTFSISLPLLLFILFSKIFLL